MMEHPTRRYTRDYRAHLAAAIYDMFDGLAFAVGDFDASDILEIILERNDNEGFDFAFNAPLDGVLRVEGLHFSPEYVRAVYDEVARVFPDWPEGMR